MYMRIYVISLFLQQGMLGKMNLTKLFMERPHTPVDSFKNTKNESNKHSTSPKAQPPPSQPSQLSVIATTHKGAFYI